MFIFRTLVFALCITEEDSCYPPRNDTSQKRHQLPSDSASKDTGSYSNIYARALMWGAWNPTCTNFTKAYSILNDFVGATTPSIVTPLLFHFLIWIQSMFSSIVEIDSHYSHSASGICAFIFESVNPSVHNPLQKTLFPYRAESIWQISAPCTCSVHRKRITAHWPLVHTGSAMAELTWLQ